MALFSKESAAKKANTGAIYANSQNEATTYIKSYDSNCFSHHLLESIQINKERKKIYD